MSTPQKPSTRDRLLAPPQSPEVRRRLGIAPAGDGETMGVSLDQPGHILVYSPAQHMAEMRARRQSKGIGGE